MSSWSGEGLDRTQRSLRQTERNWQLLRKIVTYQYFSTMRPKQTHQFTERPLLLFTADICLYWKWALSSRWQELPVWWENILRAFPSIDKQACVCVPDVLQVSGRILAQVHSRWELWSKLHSPSCSCRAKQQVVTHELNHWLTVGLCLYDQLISSNNLPIMPKKTNRKSW